MGRRRITILLQEESIYFFLNKEACVTTPNIFCLLLMLEVPFAESCPNFGLGNEDLFWDIRE